MAEYTEKKKEPEAMHIDEEEEKKTTDLTESILSLTRIRRIIKADPDTKQISSDAVFLITKATVRIKLLLRLKWADFSKVARLLLYFPLFRSKCSPFCSP